MARVAARADRGATPSVPARCPVQNGRRIGGSIGWRRYLTRPLDDDLPELGHAPHAMAKTLPDEDQPEETNSKPSSC